MGNTKRLLSDIAEDLNEVLDNHELEEKIMEAYKHFGKLSHSFLARKFKLNSETVQTIMKIFN